MKRLEFSFKTKNLITNHLTKFQNVRFLTTENWAKNIKFGKTSPKDFLAVYSFLVSVGSKGSLRLTKACWKKTYGNNLELNVSHFLLRK